MPHPRHGGHQCPCTPTEEVTTAAAHCPSPRRPKSLPHAINVPLMRAPPNPSFLDPDPTTSTMDPSRHRPQPGFHQASCGEEECLGKGNSPPPPSSHPCALPAEVTARLEGGWGWRWRTARVPPESSERSDVGAREGKLRYWAQLIGKLNDKKMDDNRT